jgi:hypothetical protein
VHWTQGKLAAGPAIWRSRFCENFTEMGRCGAYSFGKELLLQKKFHRLPVHLIFNLIVHMELGERSQYSDWLRAGRPTGRSSSPGRGDIFLFSTSSRPVLGFIQSPIQWVPRVLSPGREAHHSPPNNAEVKNTLIYISTPPILLHGIVLT